MGMTTCKTCHGLGEVGTRTGFAPCPDCRPPSGVEMENGYAVGVCCNKYHSGNRRLAHHSGSYYECQGCGEFYGAADVREAQLNGHEYTGGGGVARNV
jgi:hypothetical protein